MTRGAHCVAALLLSAAGAIAGRAPAPVSAPPEVVRPCVGPTAIPPAVDELLTRLASPVRDHCERHRLGAGATALFVRTLATVAHDETGGHIATCRWEVFRVPPDAVRHLGTLDVCRFRVERECLVGLDGAPSRVCLARSGEALRSARP